MKHEDIEDIRHNFKIACAASDNASAWEIIRDRESLVERALDELAALRERGRWRPIEEAPTDGTFVLGCHAGPWRKEYEQWLAPATISYRAFHPNAPGKTCWRYADGKPAACTHWLPLPEAPR